MQFLQLQHHANCCSCISTNNTNKCITASYVRTSFAHDCHTWFRWEIDFPIPTVVACVVARCAAAACLPQSLLLHHCTCFCYFVIFASFTSYSNFQFSLCLYCSCALISHFPFVPAVVMGGACSGWNLYFAAFYVAVQEHLYCNMQFSYLSVIQHCKHQMHTPPTSSKGVRDSCENINKSMLLL